MRLHLKGSIAAALMTSPCAAALLMKTLHTVVVDDETMFRQLVVGTLAQVSQLRVVAEFERGETALEFCEAHPPDLLVLDLLLPDMDGLEVAKKLRTHFPEMRILVMTAHASNRLPAQLMAAGVNGYIDKAEPIEYLLAAVRTVRTGGMFFATHVAAKPPSGIDLIPPPAPLRRPLTLREQDIARRVAQGQMSKELADELKLSTRTVEKHRANIFKKVGVRDTASLTRWCMVTGLVT